MTNRLLARSRQGRGQTGFTLIELMITVAVVGILAAIVYPSYRNAILKTKRAQGRTAIMEVMQQEERYMTQNNQYKMFNSATPSVFKTFSGDNPTNSAYDISADATCPNPSGSGVLAITDCIQVVATPRTSMNDTAAGALRMTSSGVKDCAMFPAPQTSPICWP